MNDQGPHKAHDCWFAGAYDGIRPPYCNRCVMPRVLNKRRDGIPSGAVYVGRPSRFGNPFSHLDGTLAEHRVATRDEAVAAYRRMLEGNAVMRAIVRRELRGKDLVCWCAPAACHADVLLEVANA